VTINIRYNPNNAFCIVPSVVRRTQIHILFIVRPALFGAGLFIAPPPKDARRALPLFTTPSVTFLQQPRNNLPAILEQCYRAAVAKLRGCWRNIPSTVWKSASTKPLINKWLAIRENRRKLAPPHFNSSPSCPAPLTLSAPAPALSD